GVAQDGGAAARRAGGREAAHRDHQRWGPGLGTGSGATLLPLRGLQVSGRSRAAVRLSQRSLRERSRSAGGWPASGEAVLRAAGPGAGAAELPLWPGAAGRWRGGRRGAWRPATAALRRAAHALAHVPDLRADRAAAHYAARGAEALLVARPARPLDVLRGRLPAGVPAGRRADHSTARGDRSRGRQPRGEVRRGR